MASDQYSGKYLALSGGVGGAKLALGLSHVLGPDQLTIVANTGDDFRHLGLTISPDLDTVMYTLAGLSNQELGWGLAGESWQCMQCLEELGGETWFRLGDRDLATHLQRSTMLASGQSLTAVTASLCRKLGLKHPVVPMTDEQVETIVHTHDESLAFQHYFVRDRCEPVVTGFSFKGIDEARPSPGFQAILEHEALQAVIICPSNPFVSVDPILKLPGVEAALRERNVPIVAISPIVGGMAIKGPAAKMMAELGMPSTAYAVAEHYEGRVDGLILDQTDRQWLEPVTNLGLSAVVAQTVMVTLDDRINLARETLAFIQSLN